MIKPMLLREVDYARPSSVDEAVELLAAHDGARALAGGQTLISVMKQRAAAPDVLVDLALLDELRGIALSADGSAIEIGAMTTSTAIVDSPVIAKARPVLAEVTGTIADLQVRNRGTIGGNVCVNDPTNHLPPLLVALGASMTIRSRAGERVVPAEQFFLGVYLTAVDEGELLTRVSVPVAGPGTGDAMSGLTLGMHGTYIVSAAASVGEHGARIAIGCVDATPVRATAMESALGGDYSEASVRAAAAGLGASLDPPSDVHASADYRRHLAEVSAIRAVLEAAKRAKGSK